MKIKQFKTGNFSASSGLKWLCTENDMNTREIWIKINK